MWAFTMRRLLYGIPILIGVSVVVVTLMQMTPGDAADLMIPADTSREVADQLRAQLGLDKPAYIQYFYWVSRLLAGDLGVSLVTNQAVAGQLGSALLNTLHLAIPAALLGFSLGITLGTLAAFSGGGPMDRVFSAIAITGVSLPHYWVGICVVAIFAVILNWLPAQGMGPEGWPTSWEHIRHLILPVVTLSLIPMGVVSRLVRANVLEILSNEFVHALHGKGLYSRTVLRHVVKNAAPSVLALMGLQFGYLLAGSILVETVFNWPGSGNLLNLAIFRRDVPVLSATIVSLATIFVVINIAVDVLQAIIDPRIRR